MVTMAEKHDSKSGEAPALSSLDEVLRRVVREELVQVVRAELPALLRATAGIPKSDLLCVDEAAHRLGVSPHTIYKRANSGKLASVKDGGRLLFRPEDLDAHIASCRRSAKTAATPDIVTAIAVHAQQTKKQKKQTSKLDEPEDVTPTK